MKNFVQSHLPTRIPSIIALMVVVFVAMSAMIPAGFMVSVSQEYYTNKTQLQQREDHVRYISEHREACNSVGGFWIEGGCTHNYPAPDTSWYVTPIHNKWETPVGVFGIIIVVAGGLMALIGPALVFEECISKREKIARDRNHNIDLLVNPGTP